MCSWQEVVYRMFLDFPAMRRPTKVSDIFSRQHCCAWPDSQHRVKLAKNRQSLMCLSIGCKLWARGEQRVTESADVTVREFYKEMGHWPCWWESNGTFVLVTETTVGHFHSFIGLCPMAMHITGWVARLCCSWLSLGESDPDFPWEKFPLGRQSVQNTKNTLGEWSVSWTVRPDRPVAPQWGTADWN